MSSNYVIKPYSKEPFVNHLNKAEDWEDDNYEYYRKDILSYVYKLNKGCCYYCKSPITYGSSLAHIEHIIDKSGHPEFSYKPENLTLSCAMCNSNKGTNEVLVQNKAEIKKFDYDDYPNDSNDFLIVHAYLDNYYNHIKFEDGIIAQSVNNSSKGDATIQMCKLYRTASTLFRSSIQKINNSPIGYSKLIAKQIGNDNENLENINNVLKEEEAEEKETEEKEEFFCINVILTDFVSGLMKENTKKRQNVVKSILKLNESHVRLYKNFISTYNMAKQTNEKFSSLMIKQFHITQVELYEIVSKMKELLYLQKNIFDLKKYRDMIKFLVHPSMKYKEINKHLEDNLGINNIQKISEVEVIYKIKPFIDLCKVLNGSDILKEIDDYLKVVNDIESMQIEEV